MNAETKKASQYALKLYLSRLLKYPLVKPGRINLCINTQCNLHCIMCDQWRKEDETSISFKQAKKLIDEMVEWGIDFLDITGGEPLLHPDIFEIINYAAGKGILTEIDTNAAFPPAVAEKALASSLDRICISLDGIKAETHNFIRGQEGAFEKTIKFIESINRHRSLPEDKPLIIIACTFMNHNMEELIDLVDFVREQHLSGVFFHPVTSGLYELEPRSGFKMPESVSCWIPPDRYSLMDSVIDKLLEIRGNIPWPIHNPPSYLQEMKNYFRIRRPDRKNNCFAGFKCFHVASNGDVGSCGQFFGTLQRPLWKSWRSRQALLSRVRIARCRRPCMMGDHTDTEANSVVKIIRDYFN